MRQDKVFPRWKKSLYFTEVLESALRHCALPTHLGCLVYFQQKSQESDDVVCVFLQANWIAVDLT